MQIVIDIPEEIYRLCQEKELLSTYPYKVIIWDAIANGTPLQEHGRLIDADAFCEKYDSNINGEFN